MYYLRKSFSIHSLQKAWLVLICSLSAYNVKAQSTSLQIFKEANGLWGIKNARGKVVKSPQYQAILVPPIPFKRDWFIVKKNDLWGIINTKGRYVIEPSLQRIDIFKAKGHLLPVLNNQGWGIINAKGKFVFKPQFQKLDLIEVGFKVQKNQLWGLINPKGKYIVRPKFGYLGDVAEGLIRVQENSLVGFINAKGEYVIPPKFQGADPFKQGYALVALNHQIGVINKSGKITVPCIYDDIRFLDAGFALVGKDVITGLLQSQGLINYTNGQQILPLKYFEIKLFTIQKKHFLAVRKMEGQFNLLNTQGKHLMGPYGAMEHLKGNEIMVIKDGKKIVVDTSGKYLRNYTVKDHNQNEGVFVMDQAMPGGGYKKLYQFFKDNMIYPQKAKKKQIEGRVVIRFTVNEDGSLSNFRILKSLGYGCDEEAIRLIKASAPWIPVKNTYQSAEKSTRIHPVSFRLPKD